jgi:hypothetical protein
MPAIDTELFQVLALALLFLTLITLLAALSVLSGIKKELTSGSRSPAVAPAPAAVASSYDYSPTPAAYEPAYTAPAATTAEASTGFVSVADAVTPLAAAGAGLRGDEPEEQPFERDGRWWFKRGGELLVYDEGTGQWVAAPGGASSAAGAGATQTLTAPTATDTGEGWKCSSCGAVNGSTATSCRMCFAPR